jgi:LuxR family maltose regulon positive regulatory protein
LGETYDWLAAYSLHLLRAGRDDAARAVIAPLVAAESPKCTALAGIVVASIDSILKNRANNPYLAHAAAYRALELADESGAFYELTRANPQAFARVLAAGSGRFAPHEHLAHQLVSVGGSDEALLTPSALTTRERQILLELRTLRTVDEIAHDLLLSVNTVKTHMRGIYRKLDVSTRRQAVITAERHGLM